MSVTLGTVIRLLLVTTIWICSSSGIKDEDGMMTYIFYKRFQPHCSGVINDIQHKYLNRSSHVNCNCMRGLEKFNVGVNKYFLARDEDEYDKPKRSLFSFTCLNESTTTTEHMVPKEFHRVESETKGQDKKTTFVKGTEDWRAFFNRAGRSMNANIRTYLDMDSLINADINTATFIKLSAPSFSVQLRNDVLPSREVIRDYLNLPLGMTTDTAFNEYFYFLKMYGSHLPINGVIGGELYLLVSNLSPADIHDLDSGDQSRQQGVINRVLGMRGMGRSRIKKFHIGGKSDQASNVDAWKSSARENPDIIRGEYAPIIDFIEKGSFTERSRNFKLILMYEQARQMLGYYLSMVMKLGHGFSSLKNFMIQELTMQAEQLCPNIFLLNHVRQGIDQMSNWSLNRLYINCTYNKENGDSINQYLFMLPGVCASFKTVVGGCQEVHIQLPVDVPYVVMYEGYECKRGRSEKILVTDRKQMSRGLSTFRSLRLCEANVDCN